MSKAEIQKKLTLAETLVSSLDSIIKELKEEIDPDREIKINNKKIEAARAKNHSYIQSKMQHERKMAKTEERITEIMQSKRVSHDEAFMLIREEVSDRMKKAWEIRRKKQRK